MIRQVRQKLVMHIQNATATNNQAYKGLISIKRYDKVVSAANGFGKDVMPRLGGLLDAQAITDIIEIVDDGQKFKRPVYAGNAVATVSTRDKIKLLTVRATNFEKLEQADAGQGYPTEDVQAITEGVKGQWKQNMVSKSKMAKNKFQVHRQGGIGLKGQNMIFYFLDRKKAFGN